MNITFKQLQIFIRLAELRSISAVARACHVTQPTVSMQLKEMTASIGMPLYEVIGKKLYLTKAGEELASTARTLAHEWGSFEQLIAAMKGYTEGSLRVAVVSTAKYFIPRMLGDFCREFPEIDIALEVQNRDGVVERLRNNMDDIYIMSMPPNDIEVVKQVFLPNPLVVLAPLRHHLAENPKLQFTQLLQERFILRERGSGTRLACEHYFAANNISPMVRLELGSNEAIKQAVAADMGLTILSRHALGEHLIDQNLTVLDVEDFPIMSNWYIVYLQGKRLSPIAGNFLGYLNQHAQDKH